MNHSVNGGVPALNNEANKSGKVQFANGQSQQAGGSFYNKSLPKNVQKSKGKSVDKKKVLPTKKFPELKLMINGEYRNGNNTLSSEDEMSLAFPPIKKIQQNNKDSSHVPLNYQQQLQNMSHYSVGANSNMGVINA